MQATLVHERLRLYRVIPFVPARTRCAPAPWVFVVPLVLLVVAIGAYKTTASAIWYDEWWSIFYAGSSHLYGPASLTLTIQRVTASSWEANPAGYFLLLNLWTRLAGDSVFAVRALSLLLAPLAVAFVYRAAADIDGRATGLIAAFLICTSAFFIRYTYEARGYMQLVMFSAGEVWSYWRLISRRPERRPGWVGALFAGSIAGLLYTHYLSIPLIGATALYHLLFARKDRQWWRVVLFGAVGALPFLPWVVVAVRGLKYISTDPARLAFARDAGTLLQRLLERVSSDSIALVGVLALYALGRRSFVWFLFAVGFLILALLNAVVPFVSDVHYLWALVPALIVVLAVGARRAPGRWLLLGVWAVAGLWTAVVPAPRDADSNKLFLPWPEVAAQLQGRAQPDDRLVFALPAPDPNWLHMPVADYYLHDLKLDVRLLESLPDTPPAYYDQELEKMTRTAQRLWTADMPDAPPSDFALDTLMHVTDRGFIACEPAYASPTLMLRPYIKATDDPLRYRFDRGITLDLAGNLPDKLSGAGSFLVRSSAPPEVRSSPYSIALHVLDLHGQIRAQMDYGLPPDSSHCHRADLPPLPDGEYTVTTSVYNWQTGERLQGRDTLSDESGDTMTLGDFTVTSNAAGS